MPELKPLRAQRLAISLSIQIGAASPGNSIHLEGEAGTEDSRQHGVVLLEEGAIGSRISTRGLVVLSDGLACL